MVFASIQSAKHLRCQRFVRLLPLLLLTAAFTAPTLAAPTVSGSFGGVTLNRAPRDRAISRLRSALAPRLERRVRLSAGPKAVFRKRRDLGIQIDIGKMLARAQKGQKRVPLLLSVNPTRARIALSRLKPTLQTERRDARPILGRGGRVSIRSEAPGVALNVSSSLARLRGQVAGNPAKTNFQLVTTRNAPTLTRARLKGINGVIGSFSTQFNPAQYKRTLNMKIATRAIDETVLSPNEVFSLNKVVGPRTQARGYRTAVIFSGGKKEPGIGGGVSQVTGTLFNAALVAGLPIVSYRVHSRPVAYLLVGRDATVSYGNFDMQFKNNTGAPIFIDYQLQGNTLRARLFGKRTGRRVRLSTASKRQGEREMSAKLYRVIRQGNKVVKKELVGDSKYSWKDDNED